MSTEENKGVVRRYLEEVVNTGDVDRLAEFISPNCCAVGEETGPARGLEEAKQHVLGLRRTYPDFHVTIERQIAEGEWVATKCLGRGTHCGSWLGMTPTGKVVEIKAVNLDRVVAGRIVEHGGAANTFEALLEIGAIRVVGPAPSGEKG